MIKNNCRFVKEMKEVNDDTKKLFVILKCIHLNNVVMNIVQYFIYQLF